MKNNDTNLETGHAEFECEKCGSVITQKVNLGHNTKVDCPLCGQKNIRQKR